MSAELAEQGGDGALQLCRDISPSLGDWREADNGRPLRRYGTWQRWPYTYLFTEHAAPAALGVTYQLSRLSAARVDTGAHDFKTYLLDEAGMLVHVIEFLNVEASDIDSIRERLEVSLAFEVRHGFTIPNPEEFAEAENELRRGFMDGVTPL